MKIVLGGFTKDAAEKDGVLTLTRTPLQTVVLALVLLFWVFSCLLPLPSP
jgi:hypothetical protein